jgi:hypothetical protein
LIVHIAHTEDAARYRGPVRFWNSQLVETLGLPFERALRVGSETGSRFTVPKTEHHEGKEFRVVPIFPELRPYLNAAWDEAERLQTEPDSKPREFVIVKHRNGPE